MRSHLQVTAAAAPAKPTSPLPPESLVEPIESIRTSFIDDFQKKRIEQGEKPAERAVFRKQHGVAKGTLGVVPSCPEKYRVGLWKDGPYTVWMRWSSDAQRPSRIRTTTRSALPSNCSA